MGILASFLLPHPNSLVDRKMMVEEDNKLVETTRAYRTIAKRIAVLEPDTIIFLTPHGQSYLDYFQIAGGESATCSYGKSRGYRGTFQLKYDVDLIKKIEEVAKREKIPTGTSGSAEEEIDHGTLIPLYFIRQYYRDFSAIRLSFSGLPFPAHYSLGKAIQEASETLGRNVVVVASGDMSHVLDKNGYYGYHDDGLKYDRRIKKILEDADFGELFKIPPDVIKNSEQCSYRVLLIMAGTLDKQDVNSMVLSYEKSRGVGYMCASFDVTGLNEERNFGEEFLEASAKETIIKSVRSDRYATLAREAIETYVREHRVMEFDAKRYPRLARNKMGCFVTIKETGVIRGCLGSVYPMKKNLGIEIIFTAISAATKDKRFPPLTEEDLKHIEVTVDFVSPPIPILSVLDLDPFKYGVMVEGNDGVAVMLPNIPGIKTAEEQLHVCKKKARIAFDDDDFQLYRFAVEHHR